MRKHLPLLVVALFFNLTAQTTYFDFASLARKDSFYKELKLKMVEARKPANFRNIEVIANGLWAAELTKDRDTAFRALYAQLLDSIGTFQSDMQRRILQAGYGLWKGMFTDPVLSFAQTTGDAKLYAMAVNYLLKTKLDAAYFKDLTLSRFPDKLQHPIIEALLGNLEIMINGRPPLPPLKDLLEFRKDSSVFRMYFFVRQDRAHSGRIVFRNQDGNFLRDSSGKVLTLPYFAMALPNLPGYITNGNSPQGCFSVAGVYNSGAKLIGPTPRIRLFMPSETDNRTFYNSNQVNGRDDRELYLSLFPESWRGYFPVLETYYAGKAGRNDIVMHGTTVDQRYFLNEVYYPNVPTHGCLSAIEKWDDKGYLTFSDQQKLLDIYASLGNPKGFIYLIEIDDKDTDVSQEDVDHIFNKAGIK